ncbi:hypothetical protein Q5H91_10490 [Sphingomonas sp. KR1UV-12]|uniref:Uncharacterized protein n=1 Tax=Sphingomonas aurea TaxID=3063994 RepID=A0ABT9EKZ7_9SPHN|nr:hypothetical protein [Sphingomonas sp. KR1UV-12]MDP1027642.1 hypothetical protein [Sphingomonas sp. KR1UV-12]
MRKAAQGGTISFARIGGRGGLRIVSPQVGRKPGEAPGPTAVPLFVGGAGDIVLIAETDPATDSGTIGRATMTGR